MPHPLLVLAATAAAYSLASDPAPNTERQRHLLRLDGDELQLERALYELARLRTTGQSAAFGARRARLLERQRGEQLALRGALSALEGAVVHELWLTGDLVVEVPPTLEREALLELPAVRSVESERWLPPAGPRMQQATDANHHDAVSVHALQLEGVPLDGTGVTLAVVDSGIDADHAGSGRPHAMLFPDGDPQLASGAGLGGSRLLSMSDVELADGANDPEDYHGHGTRMTSIAAGAAWNGLANVADGMAPGADVRFWKIAHDGLGGGLASTLNMAVAINQAAALPDVRVLNMSYFGSPNPMAAPAPAIDTAVMAGVHVSVAAGNSGNDLSFAHGCFNGIAAGGSDEATKQPSVLPGLYTSAIGPLSGRRYPHLLGQGEAVTCAVFDAENLSIESCCTSSGSALIAGAALLVQQADPSLSALETKALLLNESLEVVLGDPDARGWGYMHAKRSVDAALAGEVVEETLGLGQAKQFDVDLPAGPAAFTLVWNREQTNTIPFIADLRLRLLDGSGTVVASSDSSLDNVEQLRVQIAQAGAYRVMVLGSSYPTGPVRFALAGVDSPSVDDNFGCAGGPPSIASAAPSQVPLAPGQEVVLTGCNFYEVDAVEFAGSPVADFSALDPTQLSVKLPLAPGPGNYDLVLQSAQGSASLPIAVLPGPPSLQATPFVASGQPLLVTLGGAPGALMILCASLSDLPTPVPGLVDLGIGNGGLALHVLTYTNLPASGQEVLDLGSLGPGLPLLSTIYFQAAYLDLSLPVFPMDTTNVDETLKLF